MKSLSVLFVSVMHCIFMVNMLTRGFNLNQFVRVQTWVAREHTLQPFQVLDALP